MKGLHNGLIIVGSLGWTFSMGYVFGYFSYRIMDKLESLFHGRKKF